MSLSNLQSQTDMAIKFGDTLENQNSNYPIVDASGNNVKGVIFHTGLPSGTDFPNKRALGAILVDTSAKVVYTYKGTDITNGNWGNPDNWEEIGAGESIQTSSLPVAVGAGNSFGKYGNGSIITIPETGWSALQIIVDALTSYQAPTAYFLANAQTAINFDTVSQTGISKTIAFYVKNTNQAVVSAPNFAIAEVSLQRKLSNQDDTAYVTVASTTEGSGTFTSGALTALNTQASSASFVAFTYTDTLSTTANQDVDFVYRVKISPNDGSGTAAAAVYLTGASNNNGYVTVSNYSAPTLSFTIGLVDDSSPMSETAILRERGNVASKLDFTITCNNPLVSINTWNLQRSYDNSTWTTIYTSNATIASSDTFKLFDSIATGGTNVTPLNGTVPTNYTPVTTAIAASDVDEDEIYYRVRIIDAKQTTIVTGDDIDLEFPGLIGYSATNGSLFTSTDNGTMTAVLHSIRDGVPVMYKLLNGQSLSGDPIFSSNFTITLQPGPTEYVYIAFPAAFNEIDTIQKPNTQDEYQSFGASPKSVTVSFTTHYGVEATNAYEVYCSNSVAAFNSTQYQIN
jgi:hypothetical protein